MDNPFLALFEDNPPPIVKQPPEEEEAGNHVLTTTAVVINSFYEAVFAFTLDRSRKKSKPQQPGLKLLVLDGLANDDSLLTPDLIGQALTERVMSGAFGGLGSVVDAATGAAEADASSMTTTPTHASQTQVVTYLCDSYTRAQAWSNAAGLPEPTFASALDLIVDSLVVAFREPETHGVQDARGQLKVFAVQDDSLAGGVAAAVLNRLAGGLGLTAEARATFSPIFEWMREEAESTSFVNPYFPAVALAADVAKLPHIAEVFMLANFPTGRDPSTGKVKGSSFNQTVLGALLTKSCLPNNDHAGPWEFFETPSKYPASVHARTESQIWSSLEGSNQRTHEIFTDLFKVSTKVRHLALQWIGEVLHSNADRGKLWQSSEMGALMGNAYVSDGFMLNLSSVLLRFCLPFTEMKAGAKQGTNEKINKLNAKYLSVQVHTPDEASLTGVHLREGWKETMLVTQSAEEEENDTKEETPPPQSFNFITDVFFLAHKSLDLGFRVCHEKLVKTNQEIVRQQDIFRELRANGGGMDEGALQVQQRADALVTRFLSLKAALSEPSMIHGQVALVSSTATWVTNLSLYDDFTSPVLVNPAEMQKSDGASNPQRQIFPLQEPMPEFALERLQCLPEFLVGNLCETLLLIQRFAPQVFEEKGGYLPLMCDFVLAFMGSPQLVKNPHLRARLAECLNSLLPTHKLQDQTFAATFARDFLFDQYHYRLEIIPCILKVFVDIETTGQAVEFEVKFIYRRPMYEVLKFVWKRGSEQLPDGRDNEYVEKMRELARESEERISDETAPLFLRFVNLLINDAIYLLDEALTYMKQINEGQRERETWTGLPERERTDRERQLAHTGSNARTLNILGLDTITILAMLTSKVKEVFTHSTMVERVAAMLNYFLKTLVGPDRKSFKVKNQAEEFSFKPAEVVKQICTIYIHLAESESFLRAVSSEGRSYSHDLFGQAGSVLVRVLGDSDLDQRLQAVADRVKELAMEGSADEELFAGAPDEFLDPIMSHLMTDPVKLPNSGQIVDRMTIARHVLSDQTDPFTRAPLTMDMVVPQDDLKTKIRDWMEEQRKQNKK